VGKFVRERRKRKGERGKDVEREEGKLVRAGQSTGAEQKGGETGEREHEGEFGRGEIRRERMNLEGGEGKIETDGA
jgi:hypothetical protein